MKLFYLAYMYVESEVKSSNHAKSKCQIMPSHIYVYSALYNTEIFSKLLHTNKSVNVTFINYSSKRKDPFY